MSLRNGFVLGTNLLISIFKWVSNEYSKLHIIWTNFVNNYSVQLLCITLLHNSYHNSTDAHNYCSKLFSQVFFRTLFQNICSQLMQTTLIHNFCSQFKINSWIKTSVQNFFLQPTHGLAWLGDFFSQNHAHEPGHLLLKAWHVAVYWCPDVVMTCLIFLAMWLAKTQVSGSGSGDVVRVRKAQRQLR